MSAPKMTDAEMMLHTAYSTREALLRALATYEKTGDHAHGRKSLAPGAPCPGGDCLVFKMRRAIEALEFAI